MTRSSLKRSRLVRSAILAGLLLASATASAAAHGLGHQIVERTLDAPGVVIAVSLSTGAVLAGARFSVFAPEQPGAFVEGRTDGHGRLAFLPDRPGVWRIEIEDDQGHALVFTRSFSANGVEPAPPQWRGWLLRASLVGNLIVGGALFYRWRNRRNRVLQPIGAAGGASTSSPRMAERLEGMKP